MSDLDDDLDDPLTDKKPPVVSERLIEKLEIMCERLNALGHKHQDPLILDIQQRLWLVARFLKRDEDLSYDDIDL